MAFKFEKPTGTNDINNSEKDSVRKQILEKVDLERLENELEGILGEDRIMDFAGDSDTTYEGFLEFRRSLIYNTVEAFAKIVDETKEKAGEYDAILSDDASGRLISLTLRKVLNKVREQQDKDELPLYFMAGGRNSGGELREIAKFLKEHEELRNVLVVSEYIATGASMEEFAEVLERQSVEFDVAVLSTQDRQSLEKAHPELVKHLIVGQDDSDVGRLFYSNSNYTGVRKQFPSSKEEPSAHPIRVSEYEKDPEKVKQARNDASILAEELSKLVEEDE